MGAGAWVFPIGIVAFIGFLGAFLASHPAEPVSFNVVKPGDTITFEETAYYGDGLVAWTTDPGVIQSGKGKASPYGLLRVPDALTTTLPNATNVTDPVHKALLGKRANETVESEPFPDFFGGWDEDATHPRAIRIAAAFTLTSNPNFNVTRYIETQSGSLGRPLQVGDEVDCDVGRCRVEALSADSITFHRRIVDGDIIPVERLVSYNPNDPRPQSRFRLHPVDEDNFEAEWQPVQGDTFFMRSSPGNSADWPPGYYAFVSSDASTIHVHFRGRAVFAPDGSIIPAHLIGQALRFEYTVTKIG